MQTIASWRVHIILLGLIILFIAALVRFYPHPSQPQTSTAWDEAYFIPQTESYIVGRYFFDPHPPFARMFFYWGALLFNPDAKNNIDKEALVEHKDGYRSNLNVEGMRFFPKVFGSLVPVLMYVIVLQLFLAIYKKVDIYMVFIAAIIGVAAALENTFVLESRYVLITQILLCMMLLCVTVSLAYLLRNKKNREGGYIGLLGLTVGLAIGTKWLAASLIPFIVYLFFRAGKEKGKAGKALGTFVFSRAAGVLGLAFFVYMSLFVWHFSRFTSYSPQADEAGIKYAQDLKKGTHTTSFMEKFLTFQYLVHKYEKHVPKLDYTKPDENGSMWVNWPLMARTISYHWNTNTEGKYGFLYLIGNPFVWLMGLVGIIILTSIGIASIFVKGVKFYALQKGVLLLYFANWLPYAFIERVMYLYHYVPALAFSLIAFAVVLYEYILPLLKTDKYKTLFLTCVMLITVVVFWIYAPFTYRSELTEKEFFSRQLLKEWNMRWPEN